MVKKSIKQNEKQFEECRIICPSCKQSTRHTILHSTNVTLSYGDNIQEWISYEIVQCCGCDEVSFCKIDASSENMDYDEKEDRMVLWANTEVFPPRLAEQPGFNEESMYLLPLIVQRIYRETYKALCSDTNSD